MNINWLEWDWFEERLFEIDMIDNPGSEVITDLLIGNSNFQL